MVKHIIKLIWNEKRSNAWLFIEFVLVFCILWFCCDIIYNFTKASNAGIGYDITDTYALSLREKPHSVLTENNGGEMQEYDRTELVDILVDRISRHPDVESVGLSNYSMPYTLSNSNWGYKINDDSTYRNLAVYSVSSGFFDVFRIDVIKGRVFDDEDTADRNNVLLVPFSREGMFATVFKQKDLEKSVVPNAFDIDKLVQSEENIRTVIGVTKPLRRGYYSPFKRAFFEPVRKGDINFTWNPIAVRVKPGRSEGFRERFIADMYEQMQVGPYYLASVKSLEELKAESEKQMEFPSVMKTTFSVTFFIIVNVFLGILGTFWFRTQSRRGEIGLRMALGSSRRKVLGLFAGETLFLLFFASIVGTVICLNLNNEEIFSILSIEFNRSEWRIGSGQDILNFFMAFLFLAAVSLFAVWYPARQAAKTQPAEVLHEE